MVGNAYRDLDPSNFPLDHPEYSPWASSFQKMASLV